MKDTEDFFPQESPPDLNFKRWSFTAGYLVAALFAGIPAKNVSARLWQLAIVTAIMLIMLLMRRYPISVTISKLDCSLSYHTVDLFGVERTKIVNLPDATITYKYVYVSKGAKGWRLRLYNNYFSNRITLKEPFWGFSRNQLDQMVALVNECLGAMA